MFVQNALLYYLEGGRFLKRQKVIIDCDPGIDDSLALLYAIQHPKLDVVAITIVAGNVPVEIGVDNAF